MFANNIGGLVDGANVEASNAYGLGGFGPDDSMSIELNPGLQTTGFAVIDIAGGKP